MGDGFKIFLVIPGEDPVRDATSSMKEAEKKLRENGFITKWLPESECEKVKQKEKDRIYLFDPFDTEAFNHVRSVGCRIMGPQCILTSLQFQMDIPRRSIPIYNLAMKDLVVCCSNIDQKVREDIHQKVEYMGGSYKKDFTDIVTHLIVGEVGSKKYQVAGDLGKQIMLAPWVNAVLEASREKYIHGTDDVFQEYVCPVFKSLVVTVSGLDSEERNIVRKTVESNGGKYSGEMKVNECTHLIINKPKGTKYSFAKKWKIHIVRTDWLYDSVERGYCLDERKFSVDGDTGSDDKSSVKTSTPEKEDANRTRMSTIADISCITNMSTNQHSHINETTASNHGNHQNTSLSETMEPDRRKSEAKNSEVKRSRSIMEEMEESIKDIDLTKTPDDMFLDGCKIYLSGFRGAALEKLRKVINAGGGIRLNQLSENVTHVVIGERVESDIETLKTATYRPHTVTALWLAECYKQGHTVDEENYLSPELPPPVTESPKLAGKKKKNTDVRTGERMSQVKPAHVTEDTKPSQNTDDEFSDIMSQYLLQADQGMAGSRETTVVNQNPPPEGSQDQDDDLTQDPSKVSAMETEDTPEGKIFWKKSFLLFGFIEESEKELVDFIVEKGGKVLPHTTRTVPDYGMVPMDGYPVDRTVGEIVTNAWLQMCGEHDELLPLDSNELFSPLDINVEAQPLKTCVISVSGYSGTERDCLIYIAELLGARYQEFFVRKANKSLEANTHLVVREADGSKYTAAKKWGIPALSKRWLFACAKSGKVEPEDSYHIDCMPETNYQSQSGKLDKQGVENSVTNDRRQSAKNNDELEQNMQNKCENNRSRSDVNDKVSEWQQKIGNHDNNADGNHDNEMDIDPAENNQNVLENMHVEDQERERKSEQSDENEGSNVCDNEVKVQSPEVKDQSPTESAVQENGSRTSQKENIGFKDTPVAQNQRVKELQGSSKITPKNSRTKKDELETPSPTRFMDLTRPFRPKFDLTDLQKFLETPEPERKKREEERKNKRSSLSLEEVFAFHLDKAVKFTSQYKKKSVDMEEEGDVFIPDQMKAGPLQGVIIAVAKKLSSEQSELNNIVDSLGGDYRWQYDSSCTHFIFQGRANDTTKEFRVARDQKKTIVSPHWLYMCKEQNTRVDESSFPHNYNPNLTLAGLSNKKTSSPGRSTRRSVRNTPASSLASESTPSTATRSKQGAVEQKQKSPIVNSKSERSPKPGLAKDKSMVDGPSGDADTADHSDGNEKGDVGIAMEVGGTLDMRVELNKQLEDLMAANKKKKSTSSRRNSKKYSASGMSGDASSEGTGSANTCSSRLRENVKGDEENNSRRGSRLGKDGDSNSMPEASQVVQIAWDDPTGRLEQERLADRLARAMSPTQDMNVDLGAEFSDVEEDEQALANMEDAQQLQGEDKKEETRVPTPEAPPIAFPVNKQSTHVEPPKPIVLDDDDENVQQENRPPPVFMLSGLSQEERVDFGALIESLGGKMLDTQHYEAACTHLVIATPARNEKFLSCVAAGKWVLHKSYFEACRQEGTFVQEEFYEWGGEGTKGLVDRMTTSKKLALAAHNWRVKIQQDSQSSPVSRGAFSGWTVLICTDAKKEENFRRLLQAGGATVLGIKPPFSGNISASHAFVDLNRAALSEDCLRCLVENGVICVKPEFIAAHLTDQPAPSLEDYCPSEVQSIMNRVTAPLTGKRKTQGSGSSTSGQSRSKRLRRT